MTAPVSSSRATTQNGTHGNQQYHADRQAVGEIATASGFLHGSRASRIIRIVISRRLRHVLRPGRNCTPISPRAMLRVRSPVGPVLGVSQDTSVCNGAALPLTALSPYGKHELSSTITTFRYAERIHPTDRILAPTHWPAPWGADAGDRGPTNPSAADITKSLPKRGRHHRRPHSLFTLGAYNPRETSYRTAINFTLKHSMAAA